MNERQSDTHLYTYYANDTLNEKNRNRQLRGWLNGELRFSDTHMAERRYLLCLVVDVGSNFSKDKFLNELVEGEGGCLLFDDLTHNRAYFLFLGGFYA